MGGKGRMQSSEMKQRRVNLAADGPEVLKKRTQIPRWGIPNGAKCTSGNFRAFFSCAECPEVGGRGSMRASEMKQRREEGEGEERAMELLGISRNYGFPRISRFLRRFFMRILRGNWGPRRSWEVLGDHRRSRTS